MKRSGKFYRNNEKEVMARLGLQPTPNSGSGWVSKEDGESDDVLCQLKSTDAQSIKIDKKDLDVLQINANVTHKLPVFAIQFLRTDEVYLVIKPELLSEVVKYIETGEKVDNDILDIDIREDEDFVLAITRQVKSNSSARDSFREEMERKFKKKGKSAT